MKFMLDWGTKCKKLEYLACSEKLKCETSNLKTFSDTV